MEKSRTSKKLRTIDLCKEVAFWTGALKASREEKKYSNEDEPSEQTKFNCF